ncbi:MAG: UDP-N-acetylglucosamine 2-epimerase (non-hydrolyzing) [Bacteroidetes bacterium]|nr:MAG: UDP-N-acetylglucosamine 2-epimerase (non-hydrolyzing) [Bacteroidota bacterium]
MRLDIIAGARPNFMKIAPIIEALKPYEGKIKYRLVHTGQHYDEKMSGSFFRELGIPSPDVNLEVGSGTQAEQTSRIMTRYESLLMQSPADCCLVVGDVTSTMACSITAKKMGLKVVHVEAGIRSRDLSMPEEINRMVTDAITDYCFTTSEVANENLRELGHGEDNICFVGNTMIDTLLKNMDRLKRPQVWDDLSLKEGHYFVMTLHRPANVDEERKLAELIDEVVLGARSLPIVFPVHPRTAKVLKKLGIQSENLHMIGPLGYLEFNYLVKNAFAVITDSGGITEETTVMNVPCLTLRDNTERPETITLGTNELVGTDPSEIAPFMKRLHEGQWKKGQIPPLWDGKTGQRIAKLLLEKLG